MIEQTPNTQQPIQQPLARRVLTMVQNDRMGGSMPKWAAPETAQQEVEQSLTFAAHGIDPAQPSFEAAMAYTGGVSGAAAQQEEFTFGDLVDMVNPLHHIPVVGQVYREVTGDEIKPIGKILGGAVFGGPMGAASGLVNTVIEEETGKDIGENAMAFVLEGQVPQLGKNLSEQPERRLEQAQDIVESAADLSASLLSFTDHGANNAAFRAEKFSHFKKLHHESIARLDAMPDLGAREDITTLASISMPR